MSSHWLVAPTGPVLVVVWRFVVCACVCASHKAGMTGLWACLGICRRRFLCSCLTYLYHTPLPSLSHSVSLTVPRTVTNVSHSHAGSTGERLLCCYVLCNCIRTVQLHCAATYCAIASAICVATGALLHSLMWQAPAFCKGLAGSAATSLITYHFMHYLLCHLPHIHPFQLLALMVVSCYVCV